MAQIGRRPKSSAQKWLAGSGGHRPAKHADGDNPKMPPGLPTETKKVWRRLLGRLPYATEADSDALALLSMTLVVAAGAAAEIESRGIIPADGRSAKNPAWQIFREANQAARALLAEFGLTPAARQRLDLGEADSDEELLYLNDVYAARERQNA